MPFIHCQFSGVMTEHGISYGPGVTGGQAARAITAGCPSKKISMVPSGCNIRPLPPGLPAPPIWSSWSTTVTSKPSNYATGLKWPWPIAMFPSR